MPLFKNKTGQKVPVYAYDNAGARTGNAASITGSLSKDGAAPAAITNTNPTEIGGGWYLFDLGLAESDANLLVWFAQSATNGVKVEGGAAFTVVGVGDLPSMNLETITGDPVSTTPTIENSYPTGTPTGSPTNSSFTITGSALSGTTGAYDPTANTIWGILFLEGANAGEERKIATYTVSGPTKTITLQSALPAAPATTDQFRIRPITLTSAAVDTGAIADRIIGRSVAGGSDGGDTVGEALQSITPVDSAAIADRVIGRSIAGGADGGRTVGSSLAFSRNRWRIQGTTLYVYDELGSTLLWQATVTYNANGQITEINPL
jgi:hypothetical protein